MVLSTPIKAASGVAVTSTAVAGTALTYKYMTSVTLFQIEKDAISSKSWTVGTISEPSATGTESKTLSIPVSISKPKQNQESESSWTCTLIASITVGKDTTPILDKESIKADLKKFLGTEITVPTASDTTVTPQQLEKEGFVTSCARNRKGENQTDTKVVAEINISLETSSKGNEFKFKQTDLKEVFEGKWVNQKLNK